MNFSFNNYDPEGFFDEMFEADGKIDEACKQIQEI